jgi:hypothetical protein
MQQLDAGAEVRVFGLVKAAQHNGKTGRVSRAAAPDGRVGVKLGGQVLAVRRENLELVVRAAASATTALPERAGGDWDDVTKETLQLSAAERSIVDEGRVAVTMLRALCYGLREKKLKVFANPPRYDRLVVLTSHSATGMPGNATYTVEAGLDASAGTGWWTTKDWREPDVAEQGLRSIDAAGLEAQYSGVLAFLELCKKLGAPRYTSKTDLTDDPLPHVIKMVERVIAGSSLRGLLSHDALERADAAC